MLSSYQNSVKMKSKQPRPNDVLGRSRSKDRKFERDIALRAKYNITQKKAFLSTFSAGKKYFRVWGEAPNQ